MPPTFVGLSLMTPKSLPSIASSVAHAACLIPALWTTGHHQMGMDHKFYSHPLSPQGEIPMWEPKMNPKMNGSNQKTRISGRYLYKAQRDHQLFSSRRCHQNIVCKAGAQLSDFFPHVRPPGLGYSSHTPNRRCPLPVPPSRRVCHPDRWMASTTSRRTGRLRKRPQGPGCKKAWSNSTSPGVRPSDPSVIGEGSQLFHQKITKIKVADLQQEFTNPS